MYFFLFFPVGTETRPDRLPVGTILLLALGLFFQGLSTFRPDLFGELVRSSFLPSDPTWTGAILGLFLHGDWAHLAGNALYLFVFGLQIESRLGAAPLLLLFVSGGVAASYVQGIATPASSWARDAHVIGASGSVAALLGLTVIRFPHRRVRIAWFLFTIVGGLSRAGAVHLHAILACVLWFVFQVAHGLAAWGNGGGSVAYAAHAGGFLVGVLGSLACGLHVRVREEVHRDRGLRYFERGDWHAAAGEFTTHLELVPKDFAIARSRAVAFRLGGDRTRALAEYRRILHESLRAKDFDRVGEIHREMWGVGFYTDLSAPALLRVAFELSRARRFDDAVGVYEELATRFPDHSGADLALLRAGEFLWEKLGRLEDARDAYERLLERYPGSEWREVAQARHASMMALTGTRKITSPRPLRGSGTWRSPLSAPRETTSSPRPSRHSREG